MIASLNIWLAMALLLMLFLLLYASYLGLQLWRQKRQSQVAANDLAQAALERSAEARMSIKIICKALLKDDLSDTEAAMRIAYLSQQITIQTDEESHFQVFVKLAEATSHIPILDQWQALERKRQRQLTRDRVTIEQEFKQFTRNSAAYLASSSSASSLQQ